MSPGRITVETAHAAVSARSVVAPHTPGVYRFCDVSERVLYIGRATNLRRRVGSYWTQPDGRLADMVRRIARVETVICQSEHEAAWLERNLLEQALPLWNKTAGGQEVPVFLRLDWQSGSPGLTVVHSIEPSTGVRHFGPYLGGGKVRLAARDTLTAAAALEAAGNADPIIVRAFVEGSLPAFGAIGPVLMAVFLGASGFATLSTEVLPRWTGWLACAAALLSVSSARAILGGNDFLELVVAGGDTSAGMYSYISSLAGVTYLAWLLCVAVCMVSPHQKSQHQRPKHSISGDGIEVGT